MAGYRIKRGAGPTRAQLRAERRRARLAERMAAARTPSERIAAAAEHLRGVVTTVSAPAAERAADQAVQVLCGLAEELLAATTRRRGT
ncbi:hypothetical protein TH66_00230 [Carbonactinospora thermoautotrophica]|uniref:Uncharacterized protein n=1 Tax=Carbonactinospora thermoautotrophica TaxID=1469144 RepID=A0A132N7M5_9ACTN|nr:hypothetical protein [Carbonactinospora thermoautotrophica]KWX04623.1 hypothetical protein TR74_24165 [Carbonactinospora thermoautotrophica]KWX05977.1 hypothetical protein TH66_00230 [Carbonactinospora thermoautotrophica]